MEQVTTRLMDEKNTRQEAIRWVTREERARQDNVNRLTTLDKMEKHKSNRRKQPLE